MKNINLTVYETVDLDESGMTRIEYHNNVIQIFPNNNKLIHCVISEDGQSVLLETECLLKAIKFIDKYEKINTKQLYGKVLKWYAEGDVGQSSKFMCGRLLDLKGEYAHPYDPSDFRRCLLLLKAVPELKLHLKKMKDCSNIWKNLIYHWDELENLLLSECTRKEDYKFRSAPKTYARMKELRDERF